MYYLSKVIINDFVDEEGKESNKAFYYLVDAVSFTEVETKLHKYLEGLNFEVKTIIPKSINEIHSENEGAYFEVKVKFTQDEKPKISNSILIIQSDSLENARKFTEKLFETTIIPWSIVGVNQTKIEAII